MASSATSARWARAASPTPPAQDAFCANGGCVITRIYDQSPRHNDLTIEGPGSAGRTRDRGAEAGALPVTLGGDFADWVDANVAFPNGMVDRITPRHLIVSVRSRAIPMALRTSGPSFSEDFIQWVLEDDFPTGRPELEAVGVTFVEDVTPYEDMKFRILNASHAIIAYPAALLGIDYAHDAVAHPSIAPVLERIQHEEVIPAVASVRDMTPALYFDIVRRRFANPNIADTVARLCYDGSNRQPKFIVPAIRQALDRNLPVDGLALASALWCRYCAGTREEGTPIDPNDPHWEEVTGWHRPRASIQVHGSINRRSPARLDRPSAFATPSLPRSGESGLTECAPRSHHSRLFARS